MALMRISILPIGTASSSIGDYVAEAVRLLDRENVNYVLTDMDTVVEGNIQELLELAAELHETPFERNVTRVVTTIEIDDRRDKTVHLRDKIASVKNILAG